LTLHNDFPIPVVCNIRLIAYSNSRLIGYFSIRLQPHRIVALLAATSSYSEIRFTSCEPQIIFHCGTSGACCAARWHAR